MKNLPTLLVCLCISLGTFAQKVIREDAKINYTRLPSSPLPENVNSFSNKVTVNSLSSGLSRQTLQSTAEKKSVLNGYEAGEEGSDITIKVWVSDVRTIDRTYDSERKESKDKEGKVTVYYEYWYKYSYKAPVKLYVKDNVNDEVLFDGYVNGSQDFIGGTSPTRSSYDKLKSSWPTHLRSIGQKAINQHLNVVYSIINKRYGYTDRTVTEEVRKIKPKKYDYPNLESASELAKEAYGMMQTGGETFTQEAETKLREAISLWNKDLEEADFEAKKARVNKKVAKSIYYNLIRAHYWLGDFDKSEEYLGIVTELGSPLWLDPQKTALSARKELFEANGLLSAAD